MAGFVTPATKPVQGSKMMSSRLMNMKFMQRAAATPASNSASATAPSSEPPPKRRRIDPPASVPSTPASSNPSTPFPENAPPGTTTYEWRGAETQWVLDLPPSSSVNSTARTTNGNRQTGATDGRLAGADDKEDDGSDSDGEDDIWRSSTSGRQTFGTFKRRRGPRPSADNNNGNPSAVSNDADLSGLSSDDDGSDSDLDASGAEQQSASRASAARRAHTPDSDEEMQRAVREIQQKHGRMAAASAPRNRDRSGGRSGGGKTQGGKHGGVFKSPGKRGGGSGGNRAKDPRKKRKTM